MIFQTLWADTKRGLRFDPVLIFSLLCLIGLGFVVLASSSAAIAEQHYGDPFYYLTRQGIYLLLGAIGWFVVFNIPIDIARKWATVWLLISFILLVLVLIPGIGHPVNGSARWLSFGFFHLQASEVAKLGVVFYLADYLVRHGEVVKKRAAGFLKPMLILTLFALLLLAEPDFGAIVVLFCTTMGMMFLAGVRLRYFLIWIVLATFGLIVLAVIAPYRMERLTIFLNPWADEFNSGYQLTQALIAFGRGEWLGVGLGNGIQKLFYLPEAHTDFILAVLAEELGLLGVIVVVILFVVITTRIMRIGFYAVRQEQPFHGYLAYGVGLLFGIQFIINIGVNTGLLPTKGLTLPFVSYGGSNFIANCIALAWVFRIGREVRK